MHFLCVGGTEECPEDVSEDGIRGILKSPPRISWPAVNSPSLSKMLVIKVS